MSKHGLCSWGAFCTACGAVALLLGCPAGSSLFGGVGLTSTTVFTSSTLNGAGASSQASPVTDTADGLLVTPDNATGKVLSLLFATDGQEDEGIVIFGDGRPDIAPATATLYDFDLADSLAVNGSVSLKPGFVGGQSSLMVLLFGYIDVYFTLDGQQKVVRVAMADIDDMVRGDVLLKDSTTGSFEWYDLDAGAFTGTRPSNPVVIEDIRDFTDPIRPQLVFYPLNVELNSPVTLDAAALASSSAIESTVDFVLTQAVVIEGQHDEAAVTDALLIQNFNLTQSAFGWGDSGLRADGTLTVIP
jgi:hypothetical protein